MERTTLFLLLLIFACTGPVSDEMDQEPKIVSSYKRGNIQEIFDYLKN